MSIRLSKEPYRSNNSIYGKENLQTAKKLYAKMQKPEIPIFLLLVEIIVKSLNTLTGALTYPKKWLKMNLAPFLHEFHPFFLTPFLNESDPFFRWNSPLFENEFHPFFAWISPLCSATFLNEYHPLYEILFFDARCIQ